MNRSMRQSIPTQTSTTSVCPGFTLVELLVVLSILLVLAGITVTVVNVSLDSNRISNSARQVQSYLEGCRDRAIFAQEPRGVRFLLDEDDPTTVRSMVYIGEPHQSDGTLVIEGTGVNEGLMIRQRNGQDWSALFDKGVLQRSARIKIPDEPTGLWFNLQNTSFPITADPSGDVMKLIRQHPDYATGSSGVALTYRLELVSTILPEHEPVQLSRGIVIDLDNSLLPRHWILAADAGSQFPRTGATYSPFMDVMYSPRGVVIGPAARSGLVHFLLGDVEDVSRNLGPVDKDLDASSAIEENEAHVGDRRITTLFTRSGHASVHFVYGDETDPDDPYRYAETGEVAPE